MIKRMRLAALLAVVVCLASASAASAAFPNFTGCPREAPNFAACINVQNSGGALNIKGFNVPLSGLAIELRGGLTTAVDGNRFIPARGTNGLIGQPVRVPGGIIGIDFPIPGNSVLAITELAGPSTGIRIDLATFTLSVPVKVRLVNVLLGMNCHIGTDRNPVRMNLIVGTTSPPPPNRPISGSPGRLTVATENLLTFMGGVNVENSFAVPGATECGLGLGLINSVVNLKLGLPSAAGNNSISVTNNVAIGL